uniref:Uncharacterized protein n=1 Tax=Biomphalaria glabrata TaxID=6526 RepID=A0A2C9LSN2_BIOGL
MEESRYISSRKFVKLEQKRKSHYIKNPPYSNNSLSAMDLTTQQMLRAYYTGKTAIVQTPKKRSSNFNKALSAEQSACHSSDFNKALSAEQSACSGDYFPLYINQLIKEVLVATYSLITQKASQLLYILSLVNLFCRQTNELQASVPGSASLFHGHFGF